MANVKHSSLTGSDLHEPKGVSTASVGGSYIADGSTSGSWKQIATDANATITTMEPKGIASASADMSYMANGSSSGTWKYCPTCVYGAMRFVEVSKEFTITAADTFYPIKGASLVTPGTLYVTGQTNLITFYDTGYEDRLIAPVAGDYWITLTVSLTGIAANDIGMTVAVNGTVPSNVAIANSSVAINKTEHTTIAGMVTLSANDYIQAAIKNIGATDNVKLESSIVAIHLLKAS